MSRSFAVRLFSGGGEPVPTKLLSPLRVFHRRHTSVLAFRDVKAAAGEMQHQRDERQDDDMDGDDASPTYAAAREFPMNADLPRLERGLTSPRGQSTSLFAGRTP